MMTSNILRCSLVTLLAAGTAPSAFAQVETESVTDEIVVTAQRREQSIQDVPISVTAISGDFLQQVGAIDITDIQDFTPNATIEVARGSNSTLIAFIRGVGQQDPLWGFEAGVGIYIDDVYVARPQGSVIDIFDVERIEVLRGPQGTLYGRNTIGGAIKYVTKALSLEDPTLNARVNVGSYNQFDQIVTGSIPLSDTFAVGGSIANYQRDGFGENVITGTDHYNKDILAGRVSARWAPTDALDFRLAADMTEDNSNARHGRRLLPSADGTFPVVENEYDTLAGIGDENRVETRGVSFTGSWNVNDAITLKSITAYREGETITPIDFDALPQADFDVPAFYDDNQFSQELQLVYESDRLSGIAGLYYLDGEASGAFDVVLGGLGLTIFQAGDQAKENIAAYADFTYSLTDRFDVSLGGRYTRDKTVADVTRELWLGLGSGSFDAGNDASVFLATQTGFEGVERVDEEFTPRVALSYAVSDATNIYASYSQGFKAGGFDPRAREDLDPTGRTREGFGPETVDSYEIGMKGRLFDNRLTYSLAGFLADYTDQQITVQEGVDADGNGTNDTFISSVFNAGSSEYMGIEFEGAFRLSENFSLNTAIGYIDADIDEIISGGVNIADGFVTQNTPEWTSRFGFVWSNNLGDGDLTLTGGANFRDKYFLFNIANPGFAPGTSAVFPQGGPPLDPEAYTTFDLGANYVSPTGRWEFGVFGRNLSNERARVAAYNFVTPSQLGVDGAYSAFYIAPATVTATLAFNY